MRLFIAFRWHPGLYNSIRLGPTESSQLGISLTKYRKPSDPLSSLAVAGSTSSRGYGEVLLAKSGGCGVCVYLGGKREVGRVEGREVLGMLQP